MRRIVWIALGTLLLALPGLWWQARGDIRAESQGAEETAALLSHLLALQNSRGSELEARLAALAAPDAINRLRHLKLIVTDETGRRITPEPAPPSALASVFLRSMEPQAKTTYASWIQTGDGHRLHIALMSNPASEAGEALETLLDLALWCAFYTVLLVVGMSFAVHRAFAPLRHIVEKMADCLSQNYATRLPAFPIRELDLIGRSLNHLAEELAKTEASRRTLSLKMASVQEEERTRLVQELHDEFGQSLTAMRASASYLIRATDPQPEIQAVARELASQCQQLHGGIRDLLRQLRPQGSADAQGPVPLRNLLEKLIRSWRELPGNAVDYAFHWAAEESALAPTLSLALYRMTQEALTNAVRHGASHRIQVILRQEGECLYWSVADDGVGIADIDAALQRGNGLAGLRERIWAHGGSFNLGTGMEGKGLVLRANFRLKGHTEQEPS
ncbi:histidine kinase [Denitratisoma sp. agr-D3]